MTWAGTYTHATYFGPTDWVLLETNAGGGYSIQASCLAYKGNDGHFHMDGGNAYIGGVAGVAQLTLSGTSYSTLNMNNAAGVGSVLSFSDGGMYFGGAYYIFRNLAGSATLATLTAALFEPGVDNTQKLGDSSFRWSQLYAGTSTINTSDAREKQQASAIPDEWLDAWGEVGWCRYKLNDAVAAKGDDARWHLGALAQQIQAVFEAHGLDALTIGLLCFDAWDAVEAQEEMVGEDGEVLIQARVARAAGDRYGLRYDECFAIEAAYQRRRLDRLEVRLAAAGIA